MMKCYECNAQVSETGAICPQCGAVQGRGDLSLPFVERRLELARWLFGKNRFDEAFRVAYPISLRHPDLTAIVNWGLLFGHGGKLISATLKPADAIEPLESLDARGCALATWALARCYGKGVEGVKPDQHKAWKYTLRAAGRDVSDAQVAVGDLLLSVGARPAAFGYYERAAESGHPWGVWRIVLAFVYGRGVCPSYDRAANWAAKLPETFRYKGLWDGLVLKYRIGRRLEDPAGALEIFDRRFGGVTAEECPELYYERGTSLLTVYDDNKKDWRRGARDLRLAAEAGMTEAMERLADYYTMGREPVIRQNLEKARQLRRKAMERGDAHVMYDLAQSIDPENCTAKAAKVRRELLLKASAGGSWMATQALVFDSVG